MIYLASPYTHKDPEVMQKRHDQVCQIAANLINEGYTVFCPIAMSAAIHPYLPDERFRTFVGWEKLDLDILSHCDKIIVAELSGWEQSVGVRREIEYAESHGIEISFMDSEEIYSRIGVIV